MNEVKKLCADCKTTKTPLWRSGPHGPRSLCNACGIRYRKRKMADENPSSEIKQPSSNTNVYHVDLGIRINESFKMRLTNLQTSSSSSSSSTSSSSSSPMKRQRSSSKRELEEVEQAAVLLMSLSCGYVLA